MDNETLERLRNDSHAKQYWIVLGGYPDQSVEEGEQIFDEPIYDHGLPKHVSGMEVGDILFVHRIHASQIIYVGELLETARASTIAQAERQEWRERWSWGIKLRNLTPEYGTHWKCSERTFSHANQFNQLTPYQQINIRRLNYGSPVKISRSFAEFLLHGIMQLDATKCMREQAFRNWLLKSRGVGTVTSRLSNCRVVERWEGDLNEHFKRDRLNHLIARLTYSKDDEKANRPARHKIPIDGNVYNGTATYKAAVSLYKQFLEEESGAVVIPNTKAGAAVRVVSKMDRIPSGPASQANSQDATAAVVSTNQLAEWRRKLIRCLAEMESMSGRSDVVSVAERIARLQRGGDIPRETAAMMRIITEMRNAAEDQDKVLSVAESKMVLAAWDALKEWAQNRSLRSLL